MINYLFILEKSNLIKENFYLENKNQNLNKRINTLKKDLAGKDFYEIKNSTLKNLKDDRGFDIIGDLKKQIEIKNDYDNLIYNTNNFRQSNQQNPISATKRNNTIALVAKNIAKGNDEINNIILKEPNEVDNLDKSKSNFMRRVKQVEYLPATRNLNNSSNNMIGIFQNNLIKKNINSNINKDTEKKPNNKPLLIDNKNENKIQDKKFIINSLEDDEMKIIDPKGKLYNLLYIKILKFNFSSS